MTQEEIDIIIEKYLQGTATQEEIYHIDKFEEFAEDNIRERVFHNQLEKTEIKDSIFLNINNAIHKKIKMKTWLSVAASIVLLISAGLGYYFNLFNANNRNVEEVIWLTKTIPFGKKSSITLPDNSIVNLNSGSTIKYPEQFNNETRTVILEGEAFFDVVKNPKKPFRITAGDLKVIVLGTSFNINSYKDNDKASITVATGKVVVISKQKEKSILNPSQQVLYNKRNSTMQISNVDINKVLEWKDGILRFENVALSVAAKKLEKWYNVKIDLLDEKSKECRFSGKFNNEELPTILKSLTFLKSGLQYEYIRKDKIIIKGYCK